MFCSRCQKEYKPTYREGEPCPSCGTAMRFTSPTELFIYLCRKYGRDVMNDGARMYSLMQDHAPEKINKMQKLRMLTESGVLKDINRAVYMDGDLAQDALIAASAQLVSTYGMAPAEADKLLDIPADYFRQELGVELLPHGISMAPESQTAKNPIPNPATPTEYTPPVQQGSPEKKSTESYGDITGESPREPKKKSKKTKWPYFVAGAVLLIILLIAISSGKNNRTAEVHTLPDTSGSATDEREQAAPTAAVLRDNQLMDLVDSGAFGSITRGDIQSISVLDYQTVAPSDAYDCSANSDGSVLVWFYEHDMYIAGSGDVVAPADASGLFEGCSALTSLDLRGFDTSEVTDMSCMFSGCSSLTFFDCYLSTLNVTNMRDMFAGCSGLTLFDCYLSTWDVTDMSGMFRDCYNLTSLDLSDFSTSNVTNMAGMFYGCYNLTSLDLSGFDTSNVTNMNGMFNGCAGLTSLNVSAFDTSNVTGMEDMFRGCENLTSLDLSSFVTSGVTNMAGMFCGCGNLTSLNLSSFDTSNVTCMFEMFSQCRSLASLDLSSFDLSNVTSMEYMFDNCPADPGW